MVTGPPASTPRTTPAASPVAIVSSLDVKSKERPLSGFEEESRAVASSVRLVPEASAVEPAVSVTESTAGAFTV